MQHEKCFLAWMGTFSVIKVLSVSIALKFPSQCDTAREISKSIIWNFKESLVGRKVFIHSIIVTQNGKFIINII